ncbi:SRPBCC family protein [Streptomyces sp. H10-C2]|uniref:SRPBCC family protein n=1 Tax=unclassified Streptomyces TaxID=2593676 RepID=UPI0024BA170B|nr:MULTISPECIES: SRPBCC family protein [unclassified Streptomyces]MDJ0342589.1 SRPBCC family protein [Streptomyces sp. PH10-H1]MDJ0368557.1 SRPBCC family protein [Streptomyces sp. H10-C2]
MQNIQRRAIDAPAADVGALLDLLSTPQDQIWPAPAWSPLHLDAGLAVGSRGGHGRIRYAVTEYESGRRVRFTFAPGLGLSGYHEFLVVPDGPQRCRIVHTAAGRVEGRMRLVWPLVIRWLHEALLHDMFDNIERVATGRSPRPARWSPWVRLLRLRFAPRP